MKINFTDTHAVNNLPPMNHPVRVGKESSTETVSAKDRTPAAPDFDRVELSSHAAVPNDDTFASQLAKSVTAQVENGVSSEKVNKLREEVSSGTYHVDAERVAAKILGYDD
jgi:flagellar biosynthesis anti-sigma factor FlgM